MATATQRSCNKELFEGMTDGTFKKIVQNRGGDVDPLTAQTRAQLDDIWHGIHEIDPKVGPDGLVENSIDYVSNAHAEQV